jgi:hypothetical protein
MIGRREPSPDPHLAKDLSLGVFVAPAKQAENQRAAAKSQTLHAERWFPEAK